ncbi:hypothetical protein RSOLAG1IB_07454 [Rhizoctonia solani AG-1 IB]|uniref:Uncharacterized protein n=1 Tax=Thanatephorus cucumeris (strain AG1-IB / isolate 7/3/14) TaxID=1108050 RepID=A0A0B7FFI7_THACB|nr:hypothetical protein RSOLAG1IB_07454 [Rhizoctonia solani AG-1 IB]
MLDQRLDLFKSVRKQLGQEQQNALHAHRKNKSKDKMREQPNATYEDQDAAEKLMDEESEWFGELWGVLEKGNKLDNLLDRNNEDNIQESNNGDDDEDVVEGDQPLEGNQTAKPHHAPLEAGKDKGQISAIVVNKEQLQFDASPEEEEPNFNGSEEPDVLGINVDIAQAALLLSMWDTYTNQAKEDEKRKAAKKGKEKRKGKGKRQEQELNLESESESRSESKKEKGKGKQRKEKNQGREQKSPSFSYPAIYAHSLQVKGTRSKCLPQSQTLSVTSK